MANRRMFSKKIIDSARFLKMPNETQAFYFHLGLRADDDGVVEAYTVMRLLGVSDDNLKVLSAKGFIKVLNDDLVSHITDWSEHNSIRADRKVDSIYKNLLLEVAPETELITPKERADRPSKKDGTSQGQPKDGIGKDRIGQVRLGEVSLVEDNKELNNRKDYQENCFDTFWSVYPKKKSKAQAKKAFDKNYEQMPSIAVIVEHISKMMLTNDWKKDKGQFIPYPATWINAHGWEDEIELSDSEKVEFVADMQGVDPREVLIKAEEANRGRVN